MLIASLLAPQTGRAGDYWYCLENRDLYEYLFQFTNPWVQVPHGSFTSLGRPNMLGVTPSTIWIDANDVNHVPHLYDSRSSAWIPVVPSTYNFPPSNPSFGTMWHDSMTGFDFIFAGMWTMIGASSSGGLQPIPPGQGAPTIGAQSITGGWAAAPTPPPPGMNAPLVGNMNFNSAPTPTLTITQSALRINGLVEIFMDGTIVYDPSYTPDKAAEAMWDAIAQFSPIYKENVRIKALEDIIKGLTNEVQKYIDAGFELPQPKKAISPNDAWNAAMGVII